MLLGGALRDFLEVDRLLFATERISASPMDFRGNGVKSVANFGMCVNMADYGYHLETYQVLPSSS